MKFLFFLCVGVNFGYRLFDLGGFVDKRGLIFLFDGRVCDVDRLFKWILVIYFVIFKICINILNSKIILRVK